MTNKKHLHHPYLVLSFCIRCPKDPPQVSRVPHLKGLFALVLHPLEQGVPGIDGSLEPPWHVV